MLNALGSLWHLVLFKCMCGAALDGSRMTPHAGNRQMGASKPAWKIPALTWSVSRPRWAPQLQVLFSFVLHIESKNITRKLGASATMDQKRLVSLMFACLLQLCVVVAVSYCDLLCMSKANRLSGGLPNLGKGGSHSRHVQCVCCISCFPSR